MSATAIAVRLLLDDSAVVTAVSSRIYPVVAPQGAEKPYITCSTVYEDQDTVLQGHRDGYMTRVEIACIGPSVQAADQLGEAVKAAMSCVVNKRVIFPTDESPNLPYATATAWKAGADVLDYTDDRTIFRRILDYTIRWTR